MIETAAYIIGVVLPFALGFAVSRKWVSKDTLTRDLAYAERAVLAAEELYRAAPKSGQAKLDSALAAVTAKAGISEDEAHTLVLSAVSSLRSSGYLTSPAPAAA